ncbi:hypothetical protein B0H15DRAFT_942578 [Mycena belliarum]|uniref:Uncharacterized protein n=1 Tax=Mycena belliarum TaxID=1033014 RepID=A0AAD6ULA2_9AGAR|nr:hypothetical protein B0H15DRAFT_942578 [Mycena belliae]
MLAISGRLAGTRATTKSPRCDTTGHVRACAPATDAVLASRHEIMGHRDNPQNDRTTGYPPPILTSMRVFGRSASLAASPPQILPKVSGRLDTAHPPTRNLEPTDGVPCAPSDASAFVTPPARKQIAHRPPCALPKLLRNCPRRLGSPYWQKVSFLRPACVVRTESSPTELLHASPRRRSRTVVYATHYSPLPTTVRSSATPPRIPARSLALACLPP